MSLKDQLPRTPELSPMESIFRQQLLSLLRLRIILYTLLLGLNYYFAVSSTKHSLVPKEALLFLLIAVYLITLGSAYYLSTTRCRMYNAGLLQILFDTTFATTLVYHTGISQSGLTSVYFFPIISGGLILYRQGGLFSAALSTLQYGFILWLEVYHDIFPYRLVDIGIDATNDPIVALSVFANHGLLFFLVGTLSGFVSNRVKKTEIALTDSLKSFDQLETHYKQIFDSIGTGIITVDEQNIITSANNGAKVITGYNENTLIGTDFKKLFPNFDFKYPLSRQTTDFTNKSGDNIRLGYSQTYLQADEENRENKPPIHHKIITFRDVSEIEQLERQIRQSEKLAAIGVMSASIAHDFRNPLTAISGSAQLLTRELGKDPENSDINYELSRIILRESNRMVDTIGDFLKFSRPEHADRQWFSLSNCIEEVLQVAMADPAWPESLKLNVDTEKVEDIWADQTQMFTVFNHLIQNSWVHCPPGEEEITIKAEEVKTEDGDLVKITISDNGPGVEGSSHDKIFEPFFTTRADGTGLGLAIVKQTMEEHQGSISVEESYLGGAAFIVTLPLPS